MSTVDAAAMDYVEHARELNAIAREALRLDTRDARLLAGKISVGLSLQAGELAGKGILRGLGHSVKHIRKEHGRHNLLVLLRQAETELKERPEAELKPYRNFLLWAPEIDGTRFDSTIREYLEDHFSRGPAAHPRSYFYPDEIHFWAPQPIHALLIMMDHVVLVAEEVVGITAESSTAE